MMTVTVKSKALDQTKLTQIAYVIAFAAFGVAAFVELAPHDDGMTTLQAIGWWLLYFPELTVLKAPTNSPPEYKDPHGRFEVKYNPVPHSIKPLADDVDASDPEWRHRVRDCAGNRPIVVRNLMQVHSNRFGAVPNMTHKSLLDVYGDTHISVFTHMSRDRSAIKMTYEDFVERMHDENTQYYARAIPDVHGIFSKNIDKKWLAGLLGLKEGLKLTNYMSTGRNSNYTNVPLLFVGTSHVWSQAHCDVGTSAFLMVEGRKRWFFYSPEQTPYMHAYGQRRNVAYNSAVDVFNPDLERSPEFKKARGFEVILHAGDVLFFPSFWWHGVQNLSPETVGIDLPIIDLGGSFRRNFPLALATVFNPFLVTDYIYSMLFENGRSLPDIYFDGYVISDDRNLSSP